MDFDNRYNETDWRNSSDQEELAELARDERDLEDYTMESTPRGTGGVLAHAGEYLSQVGWCDGSGFNEEYFDVDQTRATLCTGCPACIEEREMLAAIPEEFAPEVVKPVLPERKPISFPFPQQHVARIGNGLYVALGSGKRKRRA